MSKNTNNTSDTKLAGLKHGYKIENVSVTSNGRNELYFNIKWRGDDKIDFYDLRVFDSKKNCLECCPYAMHNQRITVKDFYMDLESKKVNEETFYIELGDSEYNDNGELVKWVVWATYEPIKLNIYYETHLFRKNILEIR